jgi:glycosyltransferase involved in cell wall biosynthesis
MTGWCSDVMPYLGSADVLLHVAEFEGFPLVVIEAVAAGLPCAVREDLSREIPILSPDTVLWADDVDTLARQIQDAGVLARAAEDGRKLFTAALSASKMAKAYEALYSEILAR